MLDWILIGLASTVFANKDGRARTGGTLPSGTNSRNRPGTAVKSFVEQVAEWRTLVEPLVDRTRWIPSGTVSRIITRLPPPLSTFERVFGKTSGAANDLVEEFKAHNAAFADMQRERLRDFFANVEKSPLTREQEAACICMDDAVQVIAAAGSGKTSTMVAKTGYVLREGLAAPGEVLLMAFNSDAAKELSSRVRDRLSNFDAIEKVTAKTFHAFGIEVIAAATGKKPALAPWLEHAGQAVECVVEIIRELGDRDVKFKRDWDLYRTVYGRDIGKWGARSEPEAFEKGRRGFRTDNGEIVKSREEQRIANWLFYNSVSYEYERPYEHDTATQSHRQYVPDFYYPEVNLYHEHFALNERGEAPGHFDGDYVAGVAWKRRLHAENETALFETTSHELARGTALHRLEAELVDRGLEMRFDPDREAPAGKPLSEKEFASLLRVFQQHVKSNGLAMADLRGARVASDDDARLTLFLSLYEAVSTEWERRLDHAKCIDFEDMLLRAAGHIERGEYSSPFKVILADEFQDSSRARIRLLKALANAQEETHLCVVGDDWQGINRFAGADISVMREFESVFQHATVLPLATTFRCPQSLCDAASQFVQANPTQIPKGVRSTSAYAKRTLFAYGFQDMARADKHLEDQLRQMHGLASEGKLAPTKGERITVLLLGRYRSDHPRSLGQWQENFGDRLDVQFRTVHASKGLEAEYVMLLNVVEGVRGFPSQMEDDPLLQVPMPAPDPYPMAEERRLFYVALTRASRQVRIYTSLSQPSRFLVELAKVGTLEIEAIDGTALEACPKCGSGVMKKITGKFGEFDSCSRYPRCDYKRNPPSPASASSPAQGARSDAFRSTP